MASIPLDNATQKMTLLSMNPPPSPLTIRTLHTWEDPDDEDDEAFTWIKDHLLSMAEGRIAPSDAAIALDKHIVTVTERKLQKLLRRKDPWHVTPEEEEIGLNERIISPNARGYIDETFMRIGRMITAFPPYGDGQERILGFLESLRGLEGHQVGNALVHQLRGLEVDVGDGELDLTGDMGVCSCRLLGGGIREVRDEDIHRIGLWPFGGNWEGCAEIFKREGEEQFYPYSDVEVPGSETQIRWRNWQSALARFTTMNLIDCSFLCALGNIIPSDRDYPDLSARKIGGPNRIAGDVIAGAQWIIYLDECRYVYRQCKKEKKVDGPREIWSMENWEIWKEQFAFVEGDERFRPEAREIASLARQRMIERETEDLDNGPLSLVRYFDDPADTDYELMYKKTMLGLINGRITPSDAVDEYIAWTRQLTEQLAEKDLKPPNPKALTQAQVEVFDREIGMTAVRMIAASFAKLTELFTSFPPYHVGQTRIIQFLQGLRDIAIADFFHHSKDVAQSQEQKKARGLLKDRIVLFLQAVGAKKPPSTFHSRLGVDPSDKRGIFKLIPQHIFLKTTKLGYQTPDSDLNKPWSEVQVRWRNVQSAMARMTALDLYDCSFVCALERILPFDPSYPDLTGENRVAGLHRIGGNLVAGAQWILPEAEGRFVYAQCRKKERVDGHDQMWSMERWRMWREQFAFVEGDERFMVDYRSVAREAGRRMGELEGEDLY